MTFALGSILTKKPKKRKGRQQNLSKQKQKHHPENPCQMRTVKGQ